MSVYSFNLKLCQKLFVNGGVAGVQYKNTVNGAGQLVHADIAAAVITGATARVITHRVGADVSSIATADIVGQGLFISNKTAAFATGEVNFKVKYKHGEKEKDQKVDIENKKIKWKGKKVEVHYYDIKKGELLHDKVLESDVYEVEVILLEKPDINIVEFDIETKGLKFYYQPELTQEEIDEGAERPENVIGSYAVYHESKQGDYSKMGLKNYRAGKVFHIYRPKIIDSAGTEVWGKLNITGNLLTVEIPQEFLNNAVYPVLVDPTFGYTTLGSSASTFNSDDAIASAIYSTPIEIDTPTDIDVALYGSSKNVKLLLWKGEGGAVVANSISGAIATETAKSWCSFSFTTTPTLDPITSYYIGGVTETTNTYFAYDSGTSGDTKKDTTNSYASPNSFSVYGNYAAKLSAYVTYTVISGTKTDSAVATSTDDSFCYSTGTALCYNSGGNVRLGYRSGASWGNTHAGFRFTGLSIPQGSIIQVARFKYTAYDTDATTDSVLIYGEDVDDSVTFVESNSDANSAKNKTATTASVAWTLPNQTDNYVYVSPEIKTVIQEVVNRSGYDSASAISVLIRNNGATENHNASSYDSASAEAAELHIVYTAGGAAERRMFLTQ